MEISCNFMSRIDRSLVKINTEFHGCFMSLSNFIHFPWKNMTWILEKFKSWNFRAICQVNDGICIRFGIIFDQTAAKMTRENPCHIFSRESKKHRKLLEWLNYCEFVFYSYMKDFDETTGWFPGKPKGKKKALLAPFKSLRIPLRLIV